MSTLESPLCDTIDAEATPIRAVRNYLQDAGVSDLAVLERESRRIVAMAAKDASATKSDASLIERSLRIAVQELGNWIGATKSVAGRTDGASDVLVAAQLPDLIGRYSDAVQRNRPELMKTLVQETMCPVVPRTRARRMRPQRIALLPTWLRKLLGMQTSTAPALTERQRRVYSPWTWSRAALLFLTIVSTLVAARNYHVILAGDAGLLSWPLTGLFTMLFVWVAFSFWMATFGLVAVLRRGPMKHRPKDGESDGPLPVTAVVMPIYNEDPEIVFSNLWAVAESLRATGSESRFHLFVLSDTTDAAIRLKEEQTWAEMTTRLGSTPRLFYRHRRENTGRKAGNIAEFCSRWGADYKYMAVLDADSLMSGATLVEMVRRMERDPGLGILQAPPVPVNRQSLFGRLQQFAAQAYGAVFLEGYALWSQCDGNYWGHNAVIRVRPFMKHCDLPVLPGDGPLGGEILSHDFVEAALMRRAGWKVCLAHDLAGSYEECPATLLAFAQRDQRWCQGNLQHLRLLMAEGFHPASRLHLGMGAMSYLSSPLWFAFLMLSLTSAFVSGVFRDDQSTSGLILFAVSLALLLLPKLWGVLALRAQASPPEIQSVWRKIGVGVLLEVAASMLVAPIMMLFHSRFVVSTLLGKKVVWNTQHRGDGKMHLAEAVAVHWGHTLIGLMIGLVTYWRAPQLLPWLMPIILGLVTSIPLTMLLGSVRVGRALAERGLLLIPEEVNPPEVIQRQVSARREIKTTRNSSDRDDPLLAMLADPAQFQLHVGIIRATGCEAPVTGAERNLIVTAADIPPQLRRAVLDDLSLLESLHVGVRARMTQCAGA